ncbi:MAG TPA: hypothetical protein VFO41_13750 [Alphaproteobacteria bacterium]|nr:hypothetical protein [Alphaproteobacteria bacterium]
MPIALIVRRGSRLIDRPADRDPPFAGRGGAGRDPQVEAQPAGAPGRRGLEVDVKPGGRDPGGGRRHDPADPDLASRRGGEAGRRPRLEAPGDPGAARPDQPARVISIAAGPRLRTRRSSVTLPSACRPWPHSTTGSVSAARRRLSRHSRMPVAAAAAALTTAAAKPIHAAQFPSGPMPSGPALPPVP